MKLVKNEKIWRPLLQRGDEAAHGRSGHQLNYEAALRIVADNETL